MGSNTFLIEKESAINQWIKECCELNPSSFSTSSDLYASWVLWNEKYKRFSGSINSFSRTLSTIQGIVRERTPNNRGFRGIVQKGQQFQCKPLSIKKVKRDVNYLVDLAVGKLLVNLLYKFLTNLFENELDIQIKSQKGIINRALLRKKITSQSVEKLFESLSINSNKGEKGWSTLANQVLKRARELNRHGKSKQAVKVAHRLLSTIALRTESNQEIW